MKYPLMAAFALLVAAVFVAAQQPTAFSVSSAIAIAGTSATNTYPILSVDSGGRLNVNSSNVVGTTDPCGSAGVQKSSVQVNISTATTTALVAVSGTTIVYSCGFQVASLDTTTANTIQLEYGTGAACAGSPTALTPVYNLGVQVAGANPYTLNWGPGGQSVLKPTPSGNGVCAVTTVGSTPSINVLYTFVQQ